MNKHTFNYAIYNIDIKLLQKCLFQYPDLIDNNNCKNNTMNRAIRVMLSAKPDKFNLNFLAEIIRTGAKISNDNINSSLTIALQYAPIYLLAKKSCEDNIIKLIHFLIENGAKISNLQNYKSNTLTHAINTENLKIIETIVSLNPIHDNSMYDYYGYNTLTSAVMTNNPEIVKNAIKCGALPNCIFYMGDCSTLYQTIQTNNPEILKEIIMLGTKLNEIKFLKLIFHEYVVLKSKCDYNTDTIINLFMCLGVTISEYFYNITSVKIKKTKVELKLLTCYDLLNKSRDAWNDLKKRELLLNLIGDLQCTMDELVIKAVGDGPNIKKELTLRCPNLPICCINMIYEYLSTILKFPVIDWYKFIL